MYVAANLHQLAANYVTYRLDYLLLAGEGTTIY
jgi:hypothetical protein